MAINSGQKNCTPDRKLIIDKDQDGVLVTFYNAGSYDIMLGNDSVTKNNGFILASKQTVVIDVAPNEPIYAVTNNGEPGVLSYLLTKSNY